MEKELIEQEANRLTEKFNDMAVRVALEKARTVLEMKSTEKNDFNFYTEVADKCISIMEVKLIEIELNKIKTMETITPDLQFANLNEIANLIYSTWKKVNPAAKPYLEAMVTLTNISDNYYLDSGKSIVAYFLSNAGSYRGDTARAVKNELVKRLKN